MSNKITTILLTMTLLVMVGVLHEMYALRQVVLEIGSAYAIAIKEGEMTETCNWTSGGTPHTHTATQQVGETVAEFRARFDEELNAKFADYPPDAPK